jgi:hypothetical protein
MGILRPNGKFTLPAPEKRRRAGLSDVLTGDIA